MIRIEMRATEIRAGETLSGQAIWSSDKGKTPRKVAVTVQWVVAGKGAKYEHVVGDAVEEDIGSKSQVVVPFELEVPALGPLSYEGKLFRISWEVTARADLPFAIDDVETATFTVQPALWTKEAFREFDETDPDAEEFDDELDEDEHDQESR